MGWENLGALGALRVTTPGLPERSPRSFLQEEPRHSVSPRSLALSPHLPVPASSAALNGLPILCLSLPSSFPGEARAQSRRQLQCRPLLACLTANPAGFLPGGFYTGPWRATSNSTSKGTVQRRPCLQGPLSAPCPQGPGRALLNCFPLTFLREGERETGTRVQRQKHRHQ